MSKKGGNPAGLLIALAVFFILNLIVVAFILMINRAKP